MGDYAEMARRIAELERELKAANDDAENWQRWSRQAEDAFTREVNRADRLEEALERVGDTAQKMLGPNKGGVWKVVLDEVRAALATTSPEPKRPRPVTIGGVTIGGVTHGAYLKE